jgi:hypothetical protein
MTILIPSTKDDADLQADVLAEIARDPRFRPAEIGVEVDNGVVTLTGTVSSYPKLVAAANIAVEIAGVKGVANELTLEIASTFFRNDTELVSAIREALRASSRYPTRSRSSPSLSETPTSRRRSVMRSHAARVARIASASMSKPAP